MSSAFSCPRHIVRRSRTFAFFRFALTSAGRLSANASVSGSSTDRSPSLWASPTAQATKLLEVARRDYEAGVEEQRQLEQQYHSLQQEIQRARLLDVQLDTASRDLKQSEKQWNTATTHKQEAAEKQSAEENKRFTDAYNRAGNEEEKEILTAVREYSEMNPKMLYEGYIITKIENPKDYNFELPSTMKIEKGDKIAEFNTKEGKTVQYLIDRESNTVKSSKGANGVEI